MAVLAQIVVWLNVVANALGKLLLTPISVLPGWLSATIVSVVTGVLLLAVFKYTSNQRAIKRVRNDIKANRYALALFKDSASVALRSQGRLLVGAFWLLVFALVPVLVMLVPVSLLLGQLSLWYQTRPLRVGEEAVVTLTLNSHVDAPWPEVKLQSTGALSVTTGPLRALSKREICWKIQAQENGYHQLVLQVNGERAEKELAVGDGFMRVSKLRPGWSWLDALENPWEEPFGPRSTVQSIDIDYPERASWASGTDWWMLYWFVVSMVGALCFRPLLNVNI
jgi:hypothetical protein